MNTFDILGLDNWGGNWAEITFPKTSGTVTSDKENNWPIADQRVPRYDPRHNCGTHFDPSSLVTSAVVRSKATHLAAKKVCTSILALKIPIHSTPLTLKFPLWKLTVPSNIKEKVLNFGRNIKSNKFTFGTPWLPDLLCKHWLLSPVWNFCSRFLDVILRGN